MINSLIKNSADPWHRRLIETKTKRAINLFLWKVTINWNAHFWEYNSHNFDVLSQLWLWGKNYVRVYLSLDNFWIILSELQSVIQKLKSSLRFEITTHYPIFAISHINPMQPQDFEVIFNLFHANVPLI